MWWSALLVFVLVVTSYLVPRLSTPLPAWATVTTFSLIGLLAIWVIAMWVFAIGDRDNQSDWESKRAANPNRCANCQYSFEGLDQIELCPECGHRLAYHQIVARERLANRPAS